MSSSKADSGTSRLVVPAFFTAAFAILLRLPFIARSELCGDEGVFGLMSFAIARGEDYPLYCWGAHYASALISYLAVPSMAILGPSPFSFKLPTLIYTAFLAPLIFVSLRRNFDTFNSYLAALAIAAPLPTMLQYSTLAHGGYPETYFFGFAIWVVSIEASRSGKSRDMVFAGFLMGVSFAILWLGLPFLLSALVFFVCRKMVNRRNVAAMAIGFAGGSLPFWIYNLLLAPGATFKRLGGRSLEATAQTSILGGVMGRVMNLPQWCSETLIGLHNLCQPMGGVFGAMIVITLTVWGAARLYKQKSDWGILILSFLASLLLFNLAGNLTRDRQWTTLLIGTVVALQGFGKHGARAILIPLVALSLYADVRLVLRTEPDPEIFLAANLIHDSGADGLYADYDLGYPIAFRLESRIPLSATMPPNASDRRPQWTEALLLAKRPAFLLPDDANSRTWERALVQHHIDFTSFKTGSRIFYVLYSSPPESLISLARGSMNR